MSDISTLEAAIAAKALASVTGSVLVKSAIDEVALAAVRTQSTVIDVVYNASSYRPSGEIGANRQEERYQWYLYVSVPAGDDGTVGRETAYATIDELRAGLCPVDGWKPDEFSGHMELEQIEFVGTGQHNRIYLLTLGHDRWEG